ncbi:hypothetical protein CMI42_06045 [Candidatus Pacearchaeota archaeon]|nr:hypothetical protein [Candidatus Pacearchaeota archaeon]
MDKKGEGFSVGYLIAFIIGVIILVGIVYFLGNVFGWWSDTQSVSGQGKVNYGSFVTACDVLYGFGEREHRSFCKIDRTMKVFFDETKAVYNGKRYTCREVRDGRSDEGFYFPQDVINDLQGKNWDVDCNRFFNVEASPSDDIGGSGAGVEGGLRPDFNTLN